MQEQHSYDVGLVGLGGEYGGFKDDDYYEGNYIETVLDWYLNNKYLVESPYTTINGIDYKIEYYDGGVMLEEV